MPGNGLKEAFDQVERYASQLVQSDRGDLRLSNQEAKVLCLQSVNRLNLKIGRLVRSGERSSEDLRILQTFVNNLTVALKSDNIPGVKRSLSSLASVIKTIDEE
jgi:hypothetical protein